MLKKLAVVLLSVIFASACANGKFGSGSGSASGQVVPGTQSDLEVNVGDRIFFDFDKSDISAESREILDRQAAWLNQYSNVSITVEGHCDERGTREYNMALGERRANAVSKYLTSVGVKADRISVVSYGKERPAIANATSAEDEAKNRRGVTVINAAN